MQRDQVAILTSIVEAHEVPHPTTGSRESIMFLKHSGGHSLQHHALDADEVAGLDEAMVEELHGQGLLDVEYREHNLNLRPTSVARTVVDEHRRITDPVLPADIDAIQSALGKQLDSSNPLAWPRVRPVLEALQTYWRDSGFPEHGVALPPILNELSDEHGDMLKATIRSLLTGGFLETASNLSTVGIPGEVQLSAAAHSVLDGWPGASSDQLVENLLAVISAAVEEEEDPAEKRRLRKLGETLREVGVATAGDVLARVMTGGA